MRSPSANRIISAGGLDVSSRSLAVITNPIQFGAPDTGRMISIARKIREHAR
jgi:hypothetical protein